MKTQTFEPKHPNTVPAQNHNGGPAHPKQWSEEEVFNNGDLFFASLKQTLLSAKKSIHLETYIFDQDVMGNEVLSILADASHRGIQVHLLLDGVGSSDWNYADAEKWRKRGVDLRFFHPLPWQKKFRKIWRSLTFQKIALGFSKVNHRNHRKLCIVDDEIAFVGSMNISARHLKSVSGARSWRDTSVRIKGQGVIFLLDACNEAWEFSVNYYSTRRARRSFQLTQRNLKLFVQRVRMNCSKAQRLVYYQSLITHIHRSRHRIWITNAYFVPDLTIVKALSDAAQRGVDVRMLFPFKSDFFGVKLAMEGFYSALLEKGVKIYEYTPSMLHAKILMLDQWVTIGSSNLDHRSLFQDLEADVVITHPGNQELLATQFLEDLSQARELSLEQWESRSWIHRWLEKFCLRFQAVL